MTTIIFAFALTFTLALSPNLRAAVPEGSPSSATHGPKRQIAVIALSGVAGAILGLSTLSFCGRPQEKLSNIAVGAAIGVIGGALFMTAKVASEPRDLYNRREPVPEAVTPAVRTATRAPDWPTPSLAAQFEF